MPPPGLGYRSTPHLRGPSAAVVLSSLIAGVVIGILAMMLGATLVAGVGIPSGAAGTLVVAVISVACASAGTWWTQTTLLRRLPARRR
ncbi:hypothetical protein [Actinoplanes sp. NPDC023714]|uniref:hypothetical protein n=1 Tax=Actinoplanes sp. NPDC023714 TaxID=3154322 RepID=UPI003410FA01